MAARTKKKRVLGPRTKSPLSDIESEIVPEFWVRDGETEISIRPVKTLRKLADYFGVSLRTAEKWSAAGLFDDAKIGPRCYDLHKVSLSLVLNYYGDSKRIPFRDPTRRKFERAMCSVFRSLPGLLEGKDELTTQSIIEGAIARVMDIVDGLVPEPEPRNDPVSNFVLLALAADLTYRTILELDERELLVGADQAQ